MSLYWRVVTLGSVWAALVGRVWAAAVVDVAYSRAVVVRTVDVFSDPMVVTGPARVGVVLHGNDVTYPTSGSMLATEAGYSYNRWGSQQYRTTLIDLFSAWLDPDTDVVEPPTDPIVWPTPRVPGVVLDGAPEGVAEYLARSAAGQRIEARVAVVSNDGILLRPPLDRYDVIRSVAGVPVTSVDGYRAAMATVTAGDPVDVTVERDTSQQVLRVTTIRRHDGTAALPVAVGEVFHGMGLISPEGQPWTLEPDMLMVGLGTYDRLTPGELTGGRSVAGAGSLDEHGRVGPVDLVAQKMAGSRRAGAEFFLTGAENCRQAQERRPAGMTVVKVETFDEAREAVASIGRGETASLPHC